VAAGGKSAAWLSGYHSGTARVDSGFQGIRLDSDAKLDTWNSSH
jgi:hypothetical protein